MPGDRGPTPAGVQDGEDCLNLNVYRPASYRPGTDGAMPVVVYVHGGAFNGGLGTERDMASFVGWAGEAPVVGVNFNYRVGALGFPSSAVAEAEGVLNLGLRDQRLLFEWVRENIGQFGGDKDRVTLMGVSAGAHSVSRDGSPLRFSDVVAWDGRTCCIPTSYNVHSYAGPGFQLVWEGCDVSCHMDWCICLVPKFHSLLHSST